MARKDRVDVAVRFGSDDLQSLICGNETLAAQATAHQIDNVLGQMREIAERLVFDLVAFAVAPAQQMAGVLAALVGAPRRDDVNCSSSLCHARISAVICWRCQIFLVTTNCTRANHTSTARRLTIRTSRRQMEGELQARCRALDARYWIALGNNELLDQHFRRVCNSLMIDGRM